MEAKASRRKHRRNKEIESSKFGNKLFEVNLYIFGSILVILIGAYFFLDKENLHQKTKHLIVLERFEKEVVAEQKGPQEELNLNQERSTQGS